MEIQYLNPVWSKLTNLEELETLRNILYYEKEFYRKTRYGKRSVISTKVPLVNKNGIFLSGFIPKIGRYCNSSKIPFNFVRGEKYAEIESPWVSSPDLCETIIKKFNLRDYQIDAFWSAIVPLRGIIHYPTGSGKTEIFLAVINTIQSIQKDSRALILVRTQDLLKQNWERAKKISEEPIGLIGGGNFSSNLITVATAQSLIRLVEDYEKNTGKVQIIIIDECDVGMSFKSQYAKILNKIKAPIRLGFSATIPTNSEALMAMEGYLGPIIISKKSAEIPDLAKPKIRLVKIPYSTDVRAQNKYIDVYELGIVHNRRRNRIIIEEVQKLVDDGRTVLVFVTRITHGWNLKRTADGLFPSLDIEFIQGSTESEARNLIKKALESGKAKAIISTTIWERGIDIPSLGAIVNAAGGKSEIRTIQIVGRGLRKAPGKEDVIIVDFFDPSHRYLVGHFGMRVTLYFEEGWM